MIIKALRLKEIALMTGFSFIGILFTEKSSWNNPFLNLKVILFIFFYVFSVFLLNSYADYTKDIHSKRLSFLNGLTRKQFAYLFIIVSVLFSIISMSVSITVFLCCGLSLLLWFLYYLPPFRLKSSFLLGTVIHFIAGILHFHSGYASYSNPGEGSLLISIYFSILLSIGHINHEILDYDDDKNNNILTTTVRIGKNKSTIIKRMLIVFSLFYLITIYLLHIINAYHLGILSIPTIIIFLSDLYLKGNEPKTFQNISRIAFGLSGILLGIYKLFLV